MVTLFILSLLNPGEIRAKDLDFSLSLPCMRFFGRPDFIRTPSLRMTERWW